MKLTPTTSPTLQRFLYAEYDSPESHYTTEFDIHCKAAVKAGLNANSSGCVSRLTGDKIPKCCRQCETGREVLLNGKVTPPAEVVAPIPIVINCACGNKREKYHQFCTECKSKNDIGIEQRAKKARQLKRENTVKMCKRCSAELPDRTLYCDACLPIIAEEKRIRKNKDSHDRYHRQVG